MRATDVGQHRTGIEYSDFRQMTELTALNRKPYCISVPSRLYGRPSSLYHTQSKAKRP